MTKNNMKTEEKIFEPNEDIHLYTIRIKVLKNCAMVFIDAGEQKEVNYHEAIGVLETQKQNMIWRQRETNIAVSKQKRKNKNKSSGRK